MTISIIIEDDQGFPIFKDLKKNVVIYKTRIGPFRKKKCVLKEPLPKIEWQILNERKKIGKYLCQKAVGKFEGRIYDACFTTEIPISSGPYKLSGLRGLILEATSQDGRVSFLFKKLELTDNFDHQIVPPAEKLTFDSREEYNKANDELNQKMLLRAKAMGVDVQIHKPHPESRIEKE